LPFAILPTGCEQSIVVNKLCTMKM